MKKIICAVIVVLFVLVALGSSAIKATEKQNVAVVQNQISNSLEDVETIGNHTYIRLNWYETSSTKYPASLSHSRAKDILRVLNEFEKAHQDLKITGWKLQDNFNAVATRSQVFGIWVDHQPK